MKDHCIVQDSRGETCCCVWLTCTSRWQFVVFLMKFQICIEYTKMVFSNGNSLEVLSLCARFHVTLRQSSIAMENGPFEDVVPSKNRDIPAS